MSKTIMRTALLVLSFLILMGTALAEGVPNVVDQAGVLTKSQQSQLERSLKNVNFTYDVRLAVYSVRSTHGMKIGDYADHVLDEQYGDGKNGNMVFVVAMDQRQWYIATDRTMRDKVSDTDGLKHIEDAVLPLLKKGNYMEAFEEYAHSSGQLLAYYNDQGKAYDKDDAFQWLDLATAAVLAALPIRILIRTASSCPNRPIPSYSSRYSAFPNLAVAMTMTAGREALTWEAEEAAMAAAAAPFKQNFYTKKSLSRNTL